MSAFTFYVFNRSGQCQYYHEWTRVVLPQNQRHHHMHGGVGNGESGGIVRHDSQRGGQNERYDESKDEDRKESPVRSTILHEDFKLMFGLCWSMKALASAIDPTSSSKPPMGAPARIGDHCSFQSFKTDSYMLHFLETLSGLKFVLCTTPNLSSLRDQLHYIYTLFLEHVVRNPLYTPGESFLYEPFTLALNKYMASLGLLK